MPQWASISKQEATRGYGGNVILEGQSLVDCINKAEELAQAGKVFIHPFDDPAIVAGQGTIGLEILEDLPTVDVIVVPVGGGGLISGIATAAKDIRPVIRIIGVQAAACPSAVRAVEAGACVQVEAERSIADGISVKRIGAIALDILRKSVDEIVLAEEEQIAEAVLMLLERKKILAEGAGAVTVAALLSKAVSVPPGKKAVLVISGGNIDSSLLDRVIRKGLAGSGRIMRVSVCLDDVPGALATLLGVVAATKANVLQIYHYRGGPQLSIYKSMVDLELETRNMDHVREVAKTLSDAGYRVDLHSQDTGVS
jgi:threonine dehydratase